MKKSLLALAVSLVAVSSAHAAWDTGYDPAGTTIANTKGNGEALFEAFDTVNGVSYALDLGVRYADMISGAAFNGQSFSVDLSVFGASSASNVSWQIVAGSGQKRNDANTAADFSKYGFITSTDASYASLATAHTTGITQSVLTGLNQVRTITGNTVGADSVNNAVTESSPFGSKYFASATTTGYIGATFGIDTYGDITGETLSIWAYGFGTASGTKTTTLLGTVTLSGNTLKFNSAAPTVPVPAAAWLMGSALLGLGGVARRRKA